MSQPASRSPSKPAKPLKDSDFRWEDPLDLEGELTEDERMVRDTARGYAQDKLMPRVLTAFRDERFDRGIISEMGELGLLGPTLPEEYGGAGADRLYSVVLMEEQTYAGTNGPGFAVHSDIIANYIYNFGNEAQRRHWLPKMASGEAIGAVAMTEPGTGSDLQAIRTRAQLDGDDYVINGSKIFITNGYLSDVVVVAVRTGDSGVGSQDISLLLVESGRPGFTKAEPLKKVGLKAQDTCELFFENVRVPRANLLGAEGGGFRMLMHELGWERLIIAILSIAGAQAALDCTLDYTRSRKVFGKAVADYQNSRFKLAEMKADITVGQVFIDRCLELVLKNELTPEAAAVAKLYTSDLVCRVVDECVQLHGGYGYMLEYPIARAFIDNRASRIYGGTNEIMKELIARTL